MLGSPAQGKGSLLWVSRPTSSEAGGGVPATLAWPQEDPSQQAAPCLSNPLQWRHPRVGEGRHVQEEAALVEPRIAIKTRSPGQGNPRVSEQAQRGLGGHGRGHSCHQF